MYNDFKFVMIFKAEIYLLLFVFTHSTSGSTDSCIRLNATQDTQFIYSHDGYGTGENYPSHSDRCWVIHADPEIFTNEVRTLLIIESLSIEYSENCTLDYLDIYAENISDSQLVEKHCEGNAYNIRYTLNSYYTYLHFVSDQSKQDAGFKITYKAVLVVHERYKPVLVNGCEYLEATTEISTFYSHALYGSTGYQNDYEACWIIHVSPNVPTPIYYGTRYGINISTNSFSLEPDPNCNLDFLSVYNGNSSGSELLSKHCGSDLIKVNATSDYMYVQFVTDKSKRFPGFRMHYSVALIDADNNTLYLPERCTYLEATHQKKYLTSHPEFGSSDCRIQYFACWIIFVATDRPNDVVQLSKKKFKLEGGTCGADYMTVYSGIESDGRELGRYCGRGFYNTASSGRYMYITFDSDESLTYGGFKLVYYAIDRDDAIFGFQFPKWAIPLLLLGILLVIAVPIAVVIWCFFKGQIKHWWRERNQCRDQFDCGIRQWWKNKFGGSANNHDNENDLPVTTSEIVLTEASSKRPAATSTDLCTSQGKDSYDNDDHTNPRSHDPILHGRTSRYAMNEDLYIAPPPYNPNNIEVDVLPPPYPGSDNE